MANENKVGKRIKTYRENLKMTLADLAEKSGVGAAVIASIEDGEVLPALGVLTKLSRALGQRLGTFMDDQFKPDPIITRADQLSSVKVAHEGENPAGYAYYSLAIGKPDRHMDPFRIEFSANAPTSPSSHEGEELIIVLAGSVERPRDHGAARGRHGLLQQRREALAARARRQAGLDLRHRVPAVLKGKTSCSSSRTHSVRRPRRRRSPRASAAACPGTTCPSRASTRWGSS